MAKDNRSTAEEWDAGTEAPTGATGPTVTVKITVETWLKRVHMSVSGPQEAVIESVWRFWSGLHHGI